ncbi:MAG: ABC transporter permease [Chitinophagaceae bacterium]
MLKNYFKIAWRNLRRNKIFSIINVVGLSAGIAFALLIGAYVWNEVQINRSLKNAGRQYFLQSNWKDANMGNDITTVGPLAKRLKEEYPQLVANYYRWDGITSVVSKGDKHLRENLQLGDSTFLSMYGFELQYGNAATALVQPFSTVITGKTAIKYFGKRDVVGETIEIQSFSGGNHAFTITGVLKDLPENSVTNLNSATNNNLFIPTNTYNYFGRADFESWDNIYLPSYVELQPGATEKNLQQAMHALLQKYAPDYIKANLTVQPMLLSNYYINRGNALVKRMMYTLSLIGLFILLMAIINFINIAISSSGNRTKEIGVRKVLGSLRSQLIAQFLAESFILVLVSTVLSLLSYSLVKNGFGKLVGKELPPLSVFPLYFIFIPLLLVFIVALLAGLYPAFVLSSLKTVDSLKGKLKTVKENVWLRKTLVGFQFCIALVVLIAAGIITQQVTHFFGQGLGYNKEFVVSSQVPRDWTRKGVEKMETVRNEFASLSQVSDVALSYEIPNGMNGGQPPVYLPGTDSTRAIPMQALTTDENYLNTYQIPLKAGNFFDGHGQDSGKVILNEQALHALGFINAIDAVGKQVRVPGDQTVFTVKGIAQDFHFGSMQQKIAPMIFFNVNFAPMYRYLSFKIKPGSVNASIEAIQKKWAQLLPGSSFEYVFMSDALSNLYSTEIQLKKAAYTSTALSLFIMLLGVLGLITLSIQKRVKEIGIRKVLGASVSNIILLFVKEFIVIIIVAAAIAVPVAVIIMNKWLNNYVYRIQLSVQPFLIAILLLVVITLLLICLQTIKAALANPVKSLRNE